VATWGLIKGKFLNMSLYNITSGISKSRVPGCFSLCKSKKKDTFESKSKISEI